MLGVDEGGTSMPVRPTVVIVSVSVTVLELGVTDVCPNKQLASIGRPMQENVMGVENEPWGAMVRVNVAVCPSVMVWLAGFAVMVKLAAFTVCVNGAEVLVRLMASPL